MTENVGTIDRIVRIALGLGLLAIALGVWPDYQTPWAWIGLIPLATGVFGTCPAYALLGISTCRTA